MTALDFSQVDWSDSDYIIAQCLDCSQGAVRQARRLHAMKPDDFACKQCGGSGLVEKWTSDDFLTRRFVGFGACACARGAESTAEREVAA